MASVKVKLYTHKTNADGTHPIIVQVIVNRKPIKKSIANIRAEQWDDRKLRVNKKHPSYASINKKISDELNRLENILIENNDISKADVKKAIAPKKTEEADIEDSTPIPYLISSFATLSQKFYNNLQPARYLSFNSVKNELEEYLEDDIPLSSVNKEWLEKYQVFLATKEVKPNKINTIAKKLACFRQIFNEALKNKAITESPFSEIKLKKQKPVKRKLNNDELEKFRETVPLRKVDLICQDVFMLQIYLRGMRIGDIIQLEDDNFVNGRLKYSDDKTDKVFDIKLVPEALEIIEKYQKARTWDTKRIFHFFKWKFDKSLSLADNAYRKRKAIESATSHVNNGLRRIQELAGSDKRVSSHMARHIFSKKAIDKIQNPRITMGLVGHTNLKVHLGYIEDLENEEELDNAADSIFEDF